MCWEERQKPIFPKSKGMKSKPAAQGYRDVPIYGTGRCSAAFGGFCLSLSWGRFGDLCSVLVGSHHSSHGLTNFYALWLSLYRFKRKIYTTCQEPSACQWNKKPHYPFRILWMCTAFLTAANRDWLEWRCTGRQGRDGKQVEKNHFELNKVIQRVSVTELNQQLGWWREVTFRWSSP